MEKFDLYKDIQNRTGGEIYIGIVGPVRTGKSTFIRRIAEQIILPELPEEQRSAATDELPASASGRMITTVEPKFIPRNAVSLQLEDGTQMKVRFVDCVGYMIPGAEGFQENGVIRMVKTPWQEMPVPFTEAARTGTRKVITEHATVGIVITTDGTIGDLPRNSYLEAEKETIQELKKLGKPFLVIVNSANPYGEQARITAEYLKNSYNVTCMVLNCNEITRKEAYDILGQFLLEFPISRVVFQIPRWAETLEPDNWLKKELFEMVSTTMKHLKYVKDLKKELPMMKQEHIRKLKTEHINLSDGSCEIIVQIQEHLYYQILSELAGIEINSEYQLISMIKELSSLKKEYEKVASAVEMVKQTGYGVISPYRDDIEMKEPEIIRQGNRYGVRIKALSPSIHLIRAEIETEVSPIVGSETQAKELIEYMRQEDKSDTGIWKTLIFGKSVEQMMEEGIHGKLSSISEENQQKLQHAMSRIVNESKGKFIFFMI